MNGDASLCVKVDEQCFSVVFFVFRFSGGTLVILTNRISYLILPLAESNIELHSVVLSFESVYNKARYSIENY